MNPRIDRPIVPIADALFLIGGERNQDDVELFQELWRKHRGGEQDAANGFDNVTPPRPSPAIRASNIVPPVKARRQSLPQTQAAKPRLKRALAEALTGVRHRRR